MNIADFAASAVKKIADNHGKKLNRKGEAPEIPVAEPRENMVPIRLKKTETKEKIKASKKFEAGPAKAVKAISRFAFLKYLESTITGFAQPTRNRSKAIKPKGSICFSGFKDNRPYAFGVGSPKQCAAYP